MVRRRLGAVLALTAAAAAAAPSSAAACAVCYGRAAGDVIGGARLATVFMLVLTYGVLFGGAALAVVVRRKHVRAASAPGAGPALAGAAAVSRAGAATPRPEPRPPSVRPFEE